MTIHQIELFKSSNEQQLHRFLLEQYIKTENKIDTMNALPIFKQESVWFEEREDILERFLNERLFAISASIGGGVWDKEEWQATKTFLKDKYPEYFKDTITLEEASVINDPVQLNLYIHRMGGYLQQANFFNLFDKIEQTGTYPTSLQILRVGLQKIISQAINELISIKETVTTDFNNARINDAVRALDNYIRVLSGDIFKVKSQLNQIHKGLINTVKTNLLAEDQTPDIRSFGERFLDALVKIFTLGFKCYKSKETIFRAHETAKTTDLLVDQIDLITRDLNSLKEDRCTMSASLDEEGAKELFIKKYHEMFVDAKQRLSIFSKNNTPITPHTSLKAILEDVVKDKNSKATKVCIELGWLIKNGEISKDAPAIVSQFFESAPLLSNFQAR